MTPICVPSLGKAGKSSTLKLLLDEPGMIENTYIFVYDFEVDAYTKAYPGANVVNVGATKNLPNKRNRILDYGKEQGWKKLLMIDDDIKGFVVKRIGEEKPERLESFNEFITIVEDIEDQLNDDYTVLCPRWNFISCDNINEGNLLIEYSQLANVFFFNLEKLGDMRFEQMSLEDIDMYIRLVLNGHKCYKLRQVQAYSTLAEDGGYQTYMDTTERYLGGIKQLHDKFEHSDSFIYATKQGFAGMRKPAFVKWLKEYHSEVALHDIPKIKGVE